MKRILLLLALCSQLLASAWATYLPTVNTPQLPPALVDGALATRQASAPLFDSSFTRTGSGIISDEVVQLGAIGSGMTVGQAYSNLNIDSGTAPGAETLFRSIGYANGAHMARFRMSRSAHLVNQNCVAMLADLIGEGVPFTTDATGLLITVTLSAGHGFTSKNIGQAMMLGGIQGAALSHPGRYVITAVSGNNITFSPVFACTWSRTTTTATVSFLGGAPIFAIGEAATVSATSDSAAIVNGVVSLLTQSNANNLANATFTCLNAGGTSGTLTLTMHAKAWTGSASGTLTAYGWNYVGIIRNGTSATAKWKDTQRKGWSSGIATMAATTDLAPLGVVDQFYGDCQIEAFSDASPASQTTANAWSSRGTAIDSLPPEDVRLYFFFSVHNGVIAPASTTRFSLGFFRTIDIGINKVQLSGVDQSGVASNMDVRVMSMPTTTVTLGGTSNTVNAESATVLAASATYTGASRDAGSTISNTRFVARAYASHAGTLRVDHSTDGTTWRRATADIAVAADGVAEASVWVTTRYHRVVFVNGATLQTAFLASSAYIKM
jgi:hypothetical protein